MDHKKPAQWVAVVPMNAEFRDGDFPIFGAVQDCFLYHWGGITHTLFNPQQYAVVRDYGVLHPKEADEIEWGPVVHAHFPPVGAGAAAYADAYCGHTAEAWVSPEGEFYVCGYMQHEFMAERIFYSRGYHDPDPEVVRHGDYLEGVGWIRLDVNGSKIRLLDTHDALSQKQIDALFDLLVVLLRRESGSKNSKMVEALRKVLSPKRPPAPKPDGEDSGE